VADPNLLVLFEDWLEALEEVVTLVKEQGSADPDQVSQKLGLSPAGAAFLVTKLKQEGRLV
jgi:Mn-dependent DtxR family transcriptional regulator